MRRRNLRITLVAYLGGGTPYQPSNTYALVMKNLGIPLADRVCALLHIHAHATADPRMFVMKEGGDTLRERIVKSSHRALAVSKIKTHTSRIFMVSGSPWRDGSNPNTQDEQLDADENTAWGILWHGGQKVLSLTGCILIFLCPLCS